MRWSAGVVKIFEVSVVLDEDARPLAARLVHLDREERRHVRDAGRLLHVVRHDHDRVVALELVHQVLDPGGRDRVERRRGLVHQDHVGLDREAAGDAEPLLLAAGETERRFLQPVLDLVPERRLVQRPLDALVEAALQAEHARPEGDVVVDRLRKRVRLLEDHPDPAPHLDRVDVARVEILAVVEDLAVDLRAGHEVVHPVEAADQRALAAPARADEGGHGVLEDVDADVPNRDVAAVRDREVADLEDGLAVRDALIAVLLRDLGETHRVDRRRLLDQSLSFVIRRVSPPSLAAGGAGW